MPISVENADNYFLSHVQGDSWSDLLDVNKKEQLLKKAENLINASFNIRTEAFETIAYEFAVYEQAIKLITMNKERFVLKADGVSSMSYDGISFQMDNSFISSISYSLLKKFIYKKVGEIL
ncbi:hypothetical protein NL868_001315 [Shigella flexneri]|nr:hypothetical protein [Shigella flexneri]